MTRALRVPEQVVLPQFDIAAGGVWWVVGTLALPAGYGTVVMAAGLGLTAYLALATRRRHGSGAALGPDRRTKLVRLLVVVVALVMGVVLGLNALSWGELAAPAACAVVAAGLFGLSAILAERAYVAAGGALLVLAAVGAVRALGTIGNTGSQGLVGLAAAVVLWVVAAYRLGMFGDLRARLGR